MKNEEGSRTEVFLYPFFDRVFVGLCLSTNSANFAHSPWLCGEFPVQHITFSGSEDERPLCVPVDQDMERVRHSSKCDFGWNPFGCARGLSTARKTTFVSVRSRTWPLFPGALSVHFHTTAFRTARPSPPQPWCVMKLAGRTQPISMPGFPVLVPLV